MCFAELHKTSGSDYTLVASGLVVDQVIAQLVVRRKLLPKTRVVSILGRLTEETHGVYNSNITNAIASIVERVKLVNRDGQWVPPPRPVRGVFGGGTFRKLAKRLINASPDMQVLTHREFLDSYDGPLRKRYEQEFANMNGRRLAANDFVVKMFLKDEKQEVPRDGFVGKAPRAIRPMSVAYNLEIGRFIKPLEKALYCGLSRLLGVGSVSKGMNAGEVANSIVAKWGLFNDPCCVFTDMSRFDQHVSYEALLAVEWICCSLLRRTTPKHEVNYFRWLFRQSLETYNVCSVSDGTIKFKHRGSLCSGVMYTSLAGVVLTCLILWSCAVDVGIRNFTLISAGDDTNPFMTYSDALRYMSVLPKYCLRYGFTVKVDGFTRSRVEHIEFCRSRPVFDGSEWVMVRNPFTSIERDLITTKLNPGEQNYYAYCCAVGDCGLALAGGIPVFQSFYRMLTRRRADRRHTLQRSGFTYMSSRMNRKVLPITMSARMSFFHAWGMDTADQCRLEYGYDGITMSYTPGIRTFHPVTTPGFANAQG